MTARSTLDTFTAAVELAATLPEPAEIYRAILAGSREVDDGLRAIRHGGGHTSGGERSSHPERQLERRQPGQFPTKDEEGNEENWEAVRGSWGQRTDRAADDMLALRKATDRALDCIATLNAVCCDAGQPDTWAEAIHDANILAETGMLQAAIDVGRNVDADAIRFAHAVDTVRAIRDSWMPHQPNQSIAEENDPWCQAHFRIGVRVDRLTRKLCRFCWDQMADLEQLGERVVLQEDRANWPTDEMLRAHADGRMVDLRKERTAWLKGRGLDPARVHQRRQQRRAG